MTRMGRYPVEVRERHGRHVLLSTNNITGIRRLAEGLKLLFVCACGRSGEWVVRDLQVPSGDIDKPLEPGEQAPIADTAKEAGRLRQRTPEMAAGIAAAAQPTARFRQAEEAYRRPGTTGSDYPLSGKRVERQTPRPCPVPTSPKPHSSLRSRPTISARR